MGIAEPDAAGALQLRIADAGGSGTISIDSDCIARMTMALSTGDTVALRGF